MNIDVWPTGTLQWQHHPIRCALGRNGISENKREGDGVTPVGCFPIRQVFYRPDRIDPPQTSVALSALTQEDGWCDEPGDSCYNQKIIRPYAASFEPLWRIDHLYDMIVVLGFNDDPPKAGLGSAIFLHVAHPDFKPTEGCVAIELADLLSLVADVDKNSRLTVHAEPRDAPRR